VGPNRLGDESPSNVIDESGRRAEPTGEEQLAAEEPYFPGLAPELRSKPRPTLLIVSLAIAGLLWLVVHSSALFAGSSGAWAPLGVLASEFLILTGLVYAVGWPIRWVYRRVRQKSKAQQRAVLAVVIVLVGGVAAAAVVKLTGQQSRLERAAANACSTTRRRVSESIRRSD
jgi:hypothetical protein